MLHVCYIRGRFDFLFEQPPLAVKQGVEEGPHLRRKIPICGGWGLNSGTKTRPLILDRELGLSLDMDLELSQGQGLPFSEWLFFFCSVILFYDQSSRFGKS